MPKLSRRTLLQGTVALGGAAFATRVLAAAPPAEPVTQALIEAAKKEGKVVYYTSIDLPVAEKICGSARAEVGRQDRQGASGLQRHDPDRNLPDGARPWLGVFRKTRQAEDHAGAVRRRSAEEARARRARDHGRRRRIRRAAA